MKKKFRKYFSIPIISDINDYQTVHLVGLSFTRSWCMKNIAKFYLKITDTKNILKKLLPNF
jgi:hypothetical protein